MYGFVRACHKAYSLMFGNYVLMLVCSAWLLWSPQEGRSVRGKWLLCVPTFRGFALFYSFSRATTFELFLSGNKIQCIYLTWWSSSKSSALLLNCHICTRKWRWELHDFHAPSLLQTAWSVHSEIKEVYIALKVRTVFTGFSLKHNLLKWQFIHFIIKREAF